MFVELTLQLAQEGREPSAADKSRNLAALRSRLGLPGGALAGTGASSAPVAPTANDGRMSARGPWRLVGASTFTGVAGFILGLFAAPAVFSVQPTRSELAESLVARAPEVAVPAHADEPGARAEQNAGAANAEAPPSAGEALGVEALTGLDAPGAREQSAEVSRASGDVTPPARRATRAVLPRARATRKAAPAADAPDFLEAVRWLRRAQRAVRRGEGALALGLLDELDGRFPPELLGEERQATRALGLCGTGEDERARELARALLAKSPRSIYAERLRASCAASAIGGDAKKNDHEGRE